MEDFFKVVFQKSTGLMGFAFRKDGNWKTRFYRYPEGLSVAIESCKVADSTGWDCYFVPALLKNASTKKQAFKESNVTWVDHDSNEAVVWIPEPSILVNTSDERYHAYWLLKEPITDRVALEDANKGLTLQHGGDGSGWDATQLLRVPNTLSKKRDQPVIVTRLENNSYNIGDFPKEGTFSLKERESLYSKHY